MVYWLLIVIFVGQSYGQIGVRHLKSYGGLNAYDQCMEAKKEGLEMEPPKNAFLQCIEVRDFGVAV